MNGLVKIPYLTIVFQNRLAPEEIPVFRGAVISKVSPELTLFHNHLENSFRFSYPLIQYKRIGGKAALFCLGNGTREIGEFFANADFQLTLGKRIETLTVDSVKADQWLLQTWDDTFRYSLRHWIPFNTENYRKYSACEGIVEQSQLLESILCANILSMGKGLGRHFDKPVSCTITDILSSRLYNHKGVKMQGFDIIFKTNVYLPNHLGLGKAVSVGFGDVESYQ